MRSAIFLLISFFLVGCYPNKDLAGKIERIAAIRTCDSNLEDLTTHLENYKNIGGNYPSQSQGLEALITKPTTPPRPRQWTQALDSDSALYDPWSKKLEYHYPGKQDPSRPEIISAGPDKIFGTLDDQSNQDGFQRLKSR